MIQSQDTEGRGGRLTVSIGLVAVVWLLAVSRWIVKDSVIPWDSKNQFYAFFRFLSVLGASDAAVV